MNKLKIDRDEVRKSLLRKIAVVNFVKADGSIREMICTLKPGLMPDTEAASKYRNNEDTIAVWDLAKNAWRSFRIDSVIGKIKYYE